MVLLINNAFLKEALDLNINGTLTTAIQPKDDYIIVSFNIKNKLEEILINQFEAINKANKEYLISEPQFEKFSKILFEYRMIIFVYDYSA